MNPPAKRQQGSGPKVLTGSREAKRQAAIVLEVLSGLRGPTEGSEAMSVSLSRYYQLETRALQGLITALEPRPKGRQTTPEQERDALAREKRRLEREVTRLQALLRAAERAVGIPAAPKASKAGKLAGKGRGKRVRRTTMVRASKAIAVLRQEQAEAAASPKPETAAKVSAGRS
jgi:hypothetical protein